MKRFLFFSYCSFIVVSIGTSLFLGGCNKQTSRVSEQSGNAPAYTRAHLAVNSDGSFTDLDCTRNIKFSSTPTMEEAMAAVQSNGCIIQKSDLAAKRAVGKYTYSYSWAIYPPYYYYYNYNNNYYNPGYNYTNNYNYSCGTYFGYQAYYWNTSNYNCWYGIGGYNYNNYYSYYSPYCSNYYGSYYSYYYNTCGYSNY